MADDGTSRVGPSEQMTGETNVITCMPQPIKQSPPITLLQEICARNGLTADYQLLSTEGSVHEPTFKIAVSVDNISAIASGHSKKKARHAAAREAIEKLRQRTDLNFEGINFDSLAPIDEPTTKSVYETAINEANPVGKLQEICMKMRVNPPDYETCDEKGLAHERIFYLTCSIASLKLNTLGEGRSKKLAKREAAEAMLKKLESTGIYDKTSSNEKAPEQNTNSLHIDADDNAHFVRARRLATELIGSLDCNVADLWKEIEMIEEDDVDPDTFWRIFSDTITSADCEIEFHQMTSTHFLLHILNWDKQILMTSFGSGKNVSAAMKNAVINAYKQIMVLMRPLTGKDSHLIPRPVESLFHQHQDPCQAVPTGS